jgi:hypothetical protein
MSNNSNARQKKQGRKKKTDPPPLQKEDKASMDSISLSHPLSLSGKNEAGLDSISLTLSQAGIEKEKDLLGPAYDEKDLLKGFAGHTLLDFFYFLTQEERIDMRKKIREANPRASGEEIKVIYRAAMKDAALKQSLE